MKYSPFHFSGGIWFGRPELLRTFAMEYKEAVEIMLDEGLANCEEQVGITTLSTSDSTPVVLVKERRFDVYLGHGFTAVTEHPVQVIS